ncbi:MAG: hypothetical protein DBY41_10175, partial [Clostridium sp.]
RGVSCVVRDVFAMGLLASGRYLLDIMAASGSGQRLRLPAFARVLELWRDIACLADAWTGA